MLACYFAIAAALDMPILGRATSLAGAAWALHLAVFLVVSAGSRVAMLVIAATLLACATWLREQAAEVWDAAIAAATS